VLDTALVKVISQVAWAVLNLDTRNFDQLQQTRHSRILREINYSSDKRNIKGFYLPYHQVAMMQAAQQSLLNSHMAEGRCHFSLAHNLA